MAHTGLGPHIIPYGTSEPQDFVLKNNGAAINGTGWDVELEVTTHLGEDVTTPLTVVWISAAVGTVRVTGTEGLPVGLYNVRYKLTAGSDIGFFPNGVRPDVWRVVTP